jgi:hypothetical protein
MLSRQMHQKAQRREAQVRLRVIGHARARGEHQMQSICFSCIRSRRTERAVAGE